MTPWLRVQVFSGRLKNSSRKSETLRSFFLGSSREGDQSLYDFLHFVLGKSSFASPHPSLCDDICLTRGILNRHSERVLDARRFKAELQAPRKQSNQAGVELVELIPNDLEQTTGTPSGSSAATGSRAT